MTVYLVCVVDGCFTYGGITCVVLVCASGGEARVWKALVRHEFCVRGAHGQCIRAPHVCVIPTDGITTKLFRIFPGDHEAASRCISPGVPLWHCPGGERNRTIVTPMFPAQEN